MDIISLGFGGGNIADKFSVYPQYTIRKIDIGEEHREKFFGLPDLQTPELFEEKCPSLEMFFKDVGKEVLFIFAGSGSISGAALRILEQLKDRQITILYIRPDISFLSEKAILHEKTTFGVLQQYTRSGLFEKMYLVDNVAMEKIIGDLPITQYYDKINELISSTLHMINVCKHIKPVLENKNELPVISRICSFGITDISSGQDRLFYPLEYITNHKYYYSYKKEDLEKDGKLLSNIKKQIKTKTEEIKVSFAIYSTEYKENFVFCEAFTHIIQGEKFDQKD